MGMYSLILICVLGFVKSQLVPIINVPSVKNVSLSQCHLIPADIIFVLDDSGSVGSANFRKEKTFVKEFVKEFDVGPRNVQFGVITFSTQSHEYIRLNSYPDKNSLLNAIDRLPYQSGNTNTADALSNTMNQGFSLPHGDRDPVTNVAMVITDGRSQRPSATAAAAAKLHNAGVTVFGIGVGSTSAKEISAIASNKEHEFHVSTFDALYKLKDDLRNRTCEAIAYSSLHCRNNIKSCQIYSHAVCVANAQWARQNCPLYCGYCGAQGTPTVPRTTTQAPTTPQPVTTTLQKSTSLMTPPPSITGVCEDRFGNCAGYGSGVCTGYREWSIINCAKFCLFCHDTTKVHLLISTFETPSPPCVDKLNNCAAYGSKACMFYKSWAEFNCPRTCGICGVSTPSTTALPTELTTTISTTTLPPPDTKPSTILNPIVTMPAVTVVGECIDHFQTGVCESYGPSMCFQLTAWAAKQCPKYCAFCSPPTTTTTLPPTTTPLPTTTTTTPPTTTTTEPPCIDVDTTCQQKGPYVCVQNKTWAEHNCRVFCLFCTPTLAPVVITQPIQSTTLAELTSTETTTLPQNTTESPTSIQPDATPTPEIPTSMPVTTPKPAPPSTIIIGR